MANLQVDQLLREGIAAARAGQKERARERLLQVITQDERIEAAWLWLSSVIDDPQERQICLENVLALNPGNSAAQKGLRWLEQQSGTLPSEQREPPQDLAPGSPYAIFRESATDASLLDAPDPEPRESRPDPQRAPVIVELDPYGCPYCAGSVSGDGSRCDHCGRLVVTRYRKGTAASGVGWLVALFIMLALAAGLQGIMVAQVGQVDQLPRWASETFLGLVLGSALFRSEGTGDLAQFAGVVSLVSCVLAGLCILTAVGLALRSRLAYFGSFLLVGVMVMVTVAGLLTQLMGWLTAILLLGLVATAVKWLVDTSPAFEWQTRRNTCDTDQDLRTDLDYHNRGRHYYSQGMWAKAAAHWKVAAQLAPGQARYRAELANAYVKMGYPGAALVEAERALASAPDDAELRAFRDLLANLEGVA